MKRHSFKTHPVTRLAAGGSLLAAGAGVGTLGAALFASSANAAGSTFVVDTLNDPGSPDPNNCITPVPGACSLRDAILAADADVDADTITFDPSISGTISLNAPLDPLTGSLIVAGPGADVLTIEGNRVASGFTQSPLFINSPYADIFSLEISGLHLNGLTAPLLDVQVGAITSFTGDLTVRDVIVSDSASQVNTGSPSGFLGGPISAGLLTYSQQSTPMNAVTLERIVVQNNVALNADPDRLTNPSSITAFANHVELIDSTVTGNSSPGLGGPLLWGSEVNVSGTNFTNNTSESQFAGLVIFSRNCSLSDSSIEHNQAPDNAGLVLLSGWQYFGPGPGSTACVVSDTSVSYNTATNGSVATLYGGNGITLNRVTVVGNVSAPSGVQPTSSGVQPASSGQYSTLNLRGDITINSSTIANNTGDGILLGGTNSGPTSTGVLSTLSALTRQSLAPQSNPNAFYSTLHISHSTISGNSGTGVNVVASPNYQPTPENIVFDHALVFGNGSGASGDVHAPSTARFSLIGAASTPPVDGAGGGNVFGIDPMLEPLQWTSPFVGVVPIPFGSAAWNAGDPAFVPPPETDQRGLPRVVDVIDIGAYEVQEAVQTPKFTG
jgi:CSLREA domain-containing protein